MNPLAEKYLRKKFIPFLFCPGCGDGMIVHAFLQAVDDLKIRDDLAMAAGTAPRKNAPMTMVTGIAVDIIPTAMPPMITVAAPVMDVAASWSVGL